MLLKRYTAFDLASKVLMPLIFFSTISKAEETIVDLSPATIVPLTLKLDIPSGWKLNSKAPSKVSIVIDTSSTVQEFKISTANESFSVQTPSKEGEYTLQLKGKVYLCEDKNLGVCTMKAIAAEKQLNMTSVKHPSNDLLIVAPVPLTAR